MRFSFRDRYRLVGRALMLAFSPKACEASFAWRNKGSKDVVPHAFFTPDKTSVSLLVDFLAQSMGKVEDIEDMNNKCSNLMVQVAEQFADEHCLPYEQVLVRTDIFVLRETLEATKDNPYNVTYKYPTP